MAFGPHPQTPLCESSDDLLREPPPERSKLPQFWDTFGQVFQDENEDDVAQIFGDSEEEAGPLILTLVDVVSTDSLQQRKCTV